MHNAHEGLLPSVTFVSRNEQQEEMKLTSIMHLSEKCFCCLQTWTMCDLLMSVHVQHSPFSPLTVKCTSAPAIASVCSICPWMCFTAYLCSDPSSPLSSVPPSREVCDIRSPNCQVWPPHSSPRPAYQVFVTLTTANYHRDGDLGFTVALWEYRYVSLNKSALPTAQNTHTHTYNSQPVHSIPIPYTHCCLTDIFTTTLLCLPQDETVLTA